MKVKKIFSMVLSAAFALNIVPASLIHASTGSGETGLISRIRQGMSELNREINVLDCGISHITAEETTPYLQNIIYSVLDETDMFYVNLSRFKYSVARDGNGGYLLKSIKDIEYTIDEEKALEYKAQFEAKSKEIISEVIRPGMTDLEKALVLHDYLVLNTTYDLDGEIEDLNGGYSAYDVLVMNNGVCQGYSLAYQYLLSMVGVESKVVKSYEMGHGWNLVKIGGQWYHVDVTWDDPVPDAPGRVKHTYFMLSDEAVSTKTALRRSPHYSWDSEGIAAEDTSFDDMFWKNVDTEMFVFDKNWYFVDSNGEYSTYNVSANEVSTNISLYEEPWYVWGKEGTATWTGKYTSLLISDGMVYFNTPKSLFSMKLDGSEKQSITYINPYENDGYCYGLVYQDDAIYAVIKQAPNQDGRLVKIIDKHFPVVSYIDTMLKKIEEMQDGERSSFDLSAEKILPARAVDLMKGRNVEITVECDDYSWAINGQNVTASQQKDVNLEINSNQGIIPEKMIEADEYIELNLDDENELEFTAEINYNIGERFAGRSAVIYSYDTVTDTIEEIDVASVDSDGNVNITVSDSSNYAVVVGDSSYDDERGNAVIEETIGDVDGSTEIDLVDLTMLSQYLLHDISLSDAEIFRADTNSDGSVAVSDLALLKQYIMKDNVKLGLK